MHLFSLKHRKNGRHVAVAVRFSIPIPKAPKSFKPVHLVKGLITVIPMMLLSFLLNSHYHFFQRQADDTNIPVEQAAAVRKQSKPIKKIKPVRTKVVVSELKFEAVKGYRPSSVPVIIPQTYRGSHRIYVYAAHETIRLTFDKVDLNRYFGPDELTVRVAKVKSPTAEPKNWKLQAVVKDDGVIMSKGKQGQPQNVALSIPVRSPGVYLIDIATNDDVFIERITSQQHLLAFDEQIYLAEGPAYTKTPFKPLTITTDSTTLVFSANHYTGRQKIKVNGKSYYLYNVRADQVVTELAGNTRVEVAKGDAIFRGDGLFAVSPAQLIPVSRSKRILTVANAVADNVLVKN